MIITCEACGTSYRLKTSMVKETGSKVRCSRCEHVFIVYPPTALARQGVQEASNGVEGTETMEFFGALEADARAAEEEARLGREGDTISDLEALIDKEGETHPGETTADALFSETETPFFSEADEAELSLSDLEAAPETDVIPLAALEGTRRSESGSESTLDMGYLTDEAPEAPAQAESVLDIGELVVQSKPVTAVEGQMDTPVSEVPDTEELDFEDLATEDWTPAEAVMDIDDLASDSGPAPEDAQPSDTVDFAEIAREEELAENEGVYGLADLEDASEPAPSGTEPGEVVEMADLEKTSVDTVDFDDLAAASSTTAEAELEPEAEIDLEDMTVAAEDEGPDGAAVVPEEGRQEPGASDSSRDMDAFTVMAEPSDFQDLSDDMAPGYEGEDEAEGGEDIDLDEFEQEEEPVREPADAVESKNKAEPPAGEKKVSAGQEKAELSDFDFGFEEEGGDTRDLEEGATLDLDLDEDEFELDLELEDDAEAGASEVTEDESGLEFDLDLEEDEAAAAEGDVNRAKSGPETDEEEFDLDLDFEEAGDKAGPEPDTQTSDFEEFDLDFEEPPETEQSVSETVDGEDWALDLEDFDLDLDEVEESSETLDLDEDGFELEFDLEGEEEGSETTAEEEPEFDLDLDFDTDLAPAAGETEKAPPADDGEAAEFDLDFDFEEEEALSESEPELEAAGDEEAADEFELDLDLDAEPESEDRYDIDLTPEEPAEEGEAAEEEVDFELDLDFSEEEDATTGAETRESAEQGEKTEEFDLSEIESFLDEDTTEASAGRTLDESTEFELELDSETAEQTMESDTEPEGGAEDELSLETMLDEGDKRGEGEEKELSMETKEQERALPDTGEAPLAPGAAEEPAGQTFEEEPEEQMPSAFSGMGAKRRKRGWGKSLLTALLVLIILGALAVGGMYYFGLEDRIPFWDQLTSERAASEPTAKQPAEAGPAAPTPPEGEATAPARAEQKSQGSAPAEEETAAPDQAGGEPEAPAAAEEEPAATANAEDEAPTPAEGEAAATKPGSSGSAEAAAAAEPGSQRIGITTNPDYRFVDNSAAGELLVITGNVTNQYNQPRRLIKVKGSLYDAAGRQPIRSNTAVAGNVISDNGLATRGLAALKQELSSAPGTESSAEGELPPGQSLPFMVVFGNLPENLASFDVEVLSSAKSATR